MWNDLSTRHLLALRAVAEEGTFGRAAERLGFTQSAVSQQISALEQLVGQVLFDRPPGPHPPMMTPAGEVLLAHTASILDQVESAQHDLDRLASGVTGKLSIGTFQSISARVLPLALRQLRVESPEVEVILDEDDREEDFRKGAILRGELDLAFVVGEVESAFESQYLGADPHVAIVTNNLEGIPEGPLELSDLVSWAMIGQPTNDTCGLIVDRGLERLGITPRYAFRSHDNGAVQAMVGAGVGVAVVPLLTVDTSDPEISIRTTVPPLEPRQLSIIWDRRRTLAPIAARFVSIVVEVCTAQFARAESLLVDSRL